MPAKKSAPKRGGSSRAALGENMKHRAESGGHRAANFSAAPQRPGGHGCSAEHREGTRAGQHALAKHVAVQGHLSRVSRSTSQRRSRHDWCDLKIEVLPAVPVVRHSDCSTRFPKERSMGPRRDGLSLRQADCAGAVGIGPGFAMDANMMLACTNMAAAGTCSPSFTSRSVPMSCRFPTGPCRHSRWAGSRKPVAKAEDLQD